MPSPQEFAERWGVANQRIMQLIADGMPTDTWEAAEAWRAGRKGGVTHQQNKLLADAANGVAPQTGEPVTQLDDELEKEIAAQRQTVRIARAKYHEALRERSKDAPKHYQTLHKAIELLSKTRKEVLAHQLATRQLVNAQTARDKFRKVLGIITQAWEQSEVRLASAANPGDKALALRVFREWRQDTMRRVWGNANAASLSLTGADLGTLTEPPADDPGPLGDEGEVGELE
jgi:hypothetical protein